MKVTDLNTDILFEADLEKLHKEYEDAKKELKHDVDNKIVLDQLKKFAVKYMSFEKKYTISKKRITEIQDTAKKVYVYVKKKIKQLREVSQISKSELKPLEDFLHDLDSKISTHTQKQLVQYEKNAQRK